MDLLMHDLNSEALSLLPDTYILPLVKKNRSITVAQKHDENNAKL